MWTAGSGRHPALSGLLQSEGIVPQDDGFCERLCLTSWSEKSESRVVWSC